MYWGWPSISTSSPVVGAPPTPRSVICPAAPPETPYPMIPRPVTNSPGICSVSVGSSDGRNPSAICCLPTTEMVIGKCRMSVSCRVPVITTSPIGWVFPLRRLSAVSDRRAHTGRMLLDSSSTNSLDFIFSHYVLHGYFSCLASHPRLSPIFVPKSAGDRRMCGFRIHAGRPFPFSARFLF